jgi:DNA-binding transcriptional LysR family regulator
VSTHQPANDLWKLQGRDGAIKTVPIKPTIICNTGAMTYQCVISHLGIGRFSHVRVQNLLTSGQLVRVLEDYELPDRELVVAYPSRKYLTSKARAFIEFLFAAVSAARVRRLDRSC